MKVNKKVSAILTLSILFAIPSIAKADENTQGAWAAVDANGTVIGVDVCSESVCGSNGEWQGKVPYCDTCTYVYQLPAENNGNVAGHKDIKYEASSNTFYAPENKIIDGVKVNYPACIDLDNPSDETKCAISTNVTTKENVIQKKTEIVTFGKYKTFSKIVGKIQVVKQKKQKKVTILKKKRKVINWSLQSKLKNAYLN